ncbi:MAG: TolC family protein [bacterium]|nr:hypothetical protein [Gammaproteobacteria bacterium]HIL97001.1 hypothetical protein [Pseudomonadales bacterium]
MQIQFHRPPWPRLFIVTAGLWIVFLPPAWADKSSSETQQIGASKILDAVYKLPSVRAAESELDSVKYGSLAASRPLYNPDLVADYEDKTDREFTVSFNQTIDWSGKRAARTRVAETQLKSSGYFLAALKNSIFTDVLRVLNQYAAATQNDILATQQVSLLEQLLNTIEDRLEAGDLGLLDAELTRLTLSEALHEAARSDREKRLALGLVEATLGRRMGGTR